MRRGPIYSTFILSLVVFVCHGDKIRVRREQENPECNTVGDCNRRWRHGEAFECDLQSRCRCHPHATFHEPNKECRCNEGFVKSEHAQNVCVAQNGTAPMPRASTPCIDSNCPKNAQCVNDKCECDSTYIMITGVCHLVATGVGDKCQYDEQCQKKLGGYSKCTSTQCECMTNAVATDKNSTCLLKKNLGEQCMKHEQCSHLLHGTCKDDICECDPGFVPYRSECLKVVDKYNEICVDLIQCSNGKLGMGSTCNGTDENSKLCKCELEYFYHTKMETCVYAKGLGDECDEKIMNCYLPEDVGCQNVECKKRKCVCKKHYRPSANNKQCESSGVLNHLSLCVILLSLVLNII